MKKLINKRGKAAWLPVAVLTGIALTAGVAAASSLTHRPSAAVGKPSAAAAIPVRQDVRTGGVGTSAHDALTVSWLSPAVISRLNISLRIPNTPAKVPPSVADTVATAAIGSGSTVVEGPVLTVMHNGDVPNSTDCLCWMLEVRPASGIVQSRAPGAPPLGTVYLCFVDAATGKWHIGMAGDGLP